MPRQVQLTVSLVSRPGVLAALTGALADAGVNITAICAEHALRAGARRGGLVHPAGRDARAGGAALTMLSTA